MNIIPQNPGKPKIAEIDIVYKFIGILILNVPYNMLKPYANKNAYINLLKIFIIYFMLSPILYMMIF